ncbi:YHYH domain-containing protein [Rhizobium sp. 25PS6]|uniref:YHYH domain-containing protein n=2 Tax=Rhizobium TaxID=379 RepID=A0A432NC21_9HYPH|nr:MULTISPECIES: YHYH domain-containing protein [Rhizobium]MBA1344130.1 YHYH domain-containing protein [Rhizobium sp. WYCCWR 11146]MBX5177154.1 YHYH domain-containing protein [Rhizobium lentis]MBX4937995.1 YHYH domain-containing protein [Rhizobium binae]MBX4944359.1 YHYH domain-containing protein [Rhizobium binae]MBX4980457.1 YHYH domain-containing protein [Rhizobium binae]
MKLIYSLFLAFTLSASSATAHGGGTDGNGCHTNHKTGGYHCH